MVMVEYGLKVAIQLMVSIKLLFSDSHQRMVMTEHLQHFLPPVPLSR